MECSVPGQFCPFRFCLVFLQVSAEPSSGSKRPPAPSAVAAWRKPGHSIWFCSCKRCFPLLRILDFLKRFWEMFFWGKWNPNKSGNNLFGLIRTLRGEISRTGSQKMTRLSKSDRNRTRTRKNLMELWTESFIKTQTRLTQMKVLTQTLSYWIQWCFYLFIFLLYL